MTTAHYQDIARRMDQAETSFIDTIIQCSGRDLVQGSYTVKHGAYLDAETIERAVELASG